MQYAARPRADTQPPGGKLAPLQRGRGTEPGGAWSGGLRGGRSSMWLLDNVSDWGAEETAWAREMQRGEWWDAVEETWSVVSTLILWGCALQLAFSMVCRGRY